MSLTASVTGKMYMLLTFQADRDEQRQLSFAAPVRVRLAPAAPRQPFGEAPAGRSGLLSSPGGKTHDDITLEENADEQERGDRRRRESADRSEERRVGK